MQAGEVIVGIQAIVRFIYPFVLPSLEGRSKHKIAEERRALLQGLLLESYPAMSAVKLLPEHNSLVGYFVTVNKTPGARGFMDAAREKIKEFEDVGEITEIEYEDWKALHPDIEIYEAPSLVIWSTELGKPLTIIPFVKQGRGKKSVIGPEIEKIEVEEREKVLV